ncbi:transmembrane protein 170A-like [Physella acuta]|uniref:transmembrane protein 170A-like n=1 Tax=Physella acuta TaxID=109671 RepID=UPI0027DE1DF4|nr:transmembrane protein 170A-like [Physella acuta]
MTRDFQAGSHDSVFSVISLSSSDGDLDTFVEIWYHVFLWALFSSLFVHIVAALIAFLRLRKHRLGRWIPVVIFTMGIISPLTGGVVSSAAIAGVFRASNFALRPYYALVCGAGQTFIVVVISFMRILATL